jgi:uncharacterized membrane protein
MKISTKISFSLVFLLVTFGFSADSFGDVRLQTCNNTSKKVSASFAGFKDGAESLEWVSHGWWNFEPGECRVVDLKIRPEHLFYFAQDTDRGRWSGDFIFCVERKRFTIDGDMDCESRGYQTERYRHMTPNRPPGGTRYVVNFNE